MLQLPLLFCISFRINFPYITLIPSYLDLHDSASSPSRIVSLMQFWLFQCLWSSNHFLHCGPFSLTLLLGFYLAACLFYCMLSMLSALMWLDMHVEDLCWMSLQWNATMFPTCDSLGRICFIHLILGLVNGFFFFQFHVNFYSPACLCLVGTNGWRLSPLLILPFMVEDGLVSVIVLFDWELQVIKFSGIPSVGVNMDPKTLCIDGIMLKNQAVAV